MPRGELSEKKYLTGKKSDRASLKWQFSKLTLKMPCLGNRKGLEWPVTRQVMCAN